MTILLINDNPVVSRLLALCTRDDAMVLEKVSNIDEASAERYDVLFADESSCTGDVASLSTRLEVGTKIYLSYSDESMAGFDATIKKPFLPSQIIEILTTVEVKEPVNEVSIEETFMDETEAEDISSRKDVPSIFPLSAEVIDEEEEQSEEDVTPEVLNLDEIEKIKALLDMDEEEVEAFDLNEEAYESRKIEVIKEQLIADGLEIFEEEEIVDELSKAKKLKKKSKELKNKTEKKKKKNKNYTEDEWSAIENAFEDAINQLKPKKIKKLLKGKKIEVHLKLEDKK